MTGKGAKNVTASVLARLRRDAKSSGAPFQQVLQLYAIERFLYRISKSGHARSVVLKGALLLKTIGIPRARPTMDIDMLRKGRADQDSLLALGDANSRMKDFYDVWICSKHLDFNDGTLFKAVDATFKNRKTTIPIGEVRAFTTAFAERHRVQWNAFAKKVGEDDLVDAFERIAEDIRIFAMPVFVWLARGHSTAQNWKAGRGWVAEVT